MGTTIADWLGARWGTVLSMVGRSVLILGILYVRSYPALVILAANAGPPRLKSQYVGTSQAVFTLGFAIGPALGVLGWNLIGSKVWWVCGGASFIGLALAWYGMRPATQEENTELATAGAQTRGPYHEVMALRAIDFHVHLPTPDWLEGSMAGYVEAAEAYFRSPVQRQSLAELASRYRDLGLRAVLLAWDAETATGRPRVPNETVAAACRDYPDVFTGLGSVDPHKSSAVAEVAAIKALGLRGVKFHPSLQAFAPDDPRYWPIFAACEEHGLLALFHTGTSGIGARRPGGQGIRIDLAHPLRLDPVAAAHPDLTVVAAHFGWPWHMDLIAIALHKTNVHIDISGWSPRRIPPEVIRELRGRLSGQFLWGSDYPLLTPERGLAEFDELGLPEDVAQAVLIDNATRILGI